MKKLTKILAIGLIAMFFLFSGTGGLSSATGEMEDLLGTDFSEDFAIEFDFNGPFGDASNLQVLSDFNNPSNPAINTVDQDEFTDLQYFMSHFNESGVETTYLALEKIEKNLTLDLLIGNDIIIGHVNASLPFQTLLQHFDHNGSDVLVANTFRGYVAYTTTPDDQILDANDKTYLGYTLVESHLIDLLNSYLTDYGFDEIGPYGYEPIYDAATKTFGMNYTNMFMVWQDTDAEPPQALKDLSEGLGKLVNLDSFEGVVTGGDLVAASLFEYLTFTYRVELNPASNDTVTIVDVITEYDVGPMKWLITKDDLTTFNLLDLFTNVDNGTNAFHVNSTEIIFSTGWNLPGGYDTWNVTIPELSFYTADAVSTRIDATAVFAHGAEGFGIAVVSSTNAIKLGFDLTQPSDLTSDSSDPVIGLEFGGTTVFETSFVGKSTYDRTFFNGTTETGLPIFVSTRAPEDLHEIINTENLIDLYFKAQSKQTKEFARFAARQLIPAISEVDLAGIDVEKTSYVTFVQMPKWSGLAVTQDPTFSAVSAIADLQDEDTETSETETDETTATTTGGGGGPTTSIPGFEILSLVAIIPIVVTLRKRKQH